jgi:hypothetical protein
MAHRAAKALKIKKYTITMNVEGDPSWKIFDVKPFKDPAKVAKEIGLPLDKVNHFEIIEQYYDVFRCSLKVNKSKQVAVLKGRKEFVDEVLER